MEWGVDGCNIPAPAYPLFYLAQKDVAFANAADAVKALMRLMDQAFKSLKILGAVGRKGHWE